MPRGPRLDTPGTLHHVMVRGIEGDPIVTDNPDREDFVFQLGRLSTATGTAVYAWALMTNHAHILLKSGREGLSSFMRKLLTGYAIRYNLKHKRHGYLFQNRYKSIVCQEDLYFQQLVSYIHLNPYRAALVHSLNELDSYPWSGHAVIMKVCKHEWQDRDYVLKYFALNEGQARNGYRLFVEEQSRIGKQSTLTGGGLIRSIGGWSEVKSLRKRGEQHLGDARILGDSEFVKEILDQADAGVKVQLNSFDLKLLAVAEVKKQCEGKDVSIELLQSGNRQAKLSCLRKEVAVILVRQYGVSLAETARLLGISTSGVAEIVKKII